MPSLPTGTVTFLFTDIEGSQVRTCNWMALTRTPWSRAVTGGHERERKGLA